MGNANKNDSLGGEVSKAGKHGKHRNKHRERPCPNPPSSPTGNTITFFDNGTRVHPDFSMKLKWNGVYTDEMGQRIPGQGVEIDHYEIQWAPCRANGNFIETEDGHPRIRRAHKKAVKGYKIVNAHIVSGTLAEFTTGKAYASQDIAVGDIVRVQDIKPPAYNGKWTVTATPTSTTFRADIGASPADLEDEGTVEGPPDPNYNIIVEKVPHPKRWFWTMRTRAWDNKNCPSDWSNWTTPVSPLAKAAPPSPLNVIVYDKGTDRIVGDWDDPVNYVAIDGTVVANAAGTTVTGTDTEFTKDLSNAQGIGKPGIQIKIGNEVRTVDTISSDTSLSVTSAWVDQHTDAVLKVEDRDPDIHHYWIQISKNNNFTNVYKQDRKHQRSRIAFKIADADKGDTFYLRTCSVDHEGVVSAWIPGKLTPNSSASADPDGVTVGVSGSGRIRFTYTVRGKLRDLDEADTADIDVDETCTLKKVRCRLKQACTGGQIYVKLYKNNTNLVATITISAGEKRGVDDGLSVSLDDGDSLSPAINLGQNVSFPGRHLTIRGVADPA